MFKKLLIALIVAVPLALIVPAETNKTISAQALLGSNYDRVQDSVGGNLEPREAVNHLGCLFVACKPRRTDMKEEVTVYYDPAIDSISVVAANSSDLCVTARRGKQYETFWMVAPPGRRSYIWIPLEPKALAAAAASIPKK